MPCVDYITISKSGDSLSTFQKKRRKGKQGKEEIRE